MYSFNVDGSLMDNMNSLWPAQLPKFLGCPTLMADDDRECLVAERSKEGARNTRRRSPQWKRRQAGQKDQRRHVKELQNLKNLKAACTALGVALPDQQAKWTPAQRMLVFEHIANNVPPQSSYWVSPEEHVRAKLQREQSRLLTGFISPGELSEELLARDEANGFMFTVDKINAKGKIGSNGKKRKTCSHCQGDHSRKDCPSNDDAPSAASGRPSRKARKAAGGPKRITKCGLCNAGGHNRRTCPTRVVAPLVSTAAPAPVPIVPTHQGTVAAAVGGADMAMLLRL